MWRTSPRACGVRAISSHISKFISSYCVVIVQNPGEYNLDIVCVLNVVRWINEWLADLCLSSRGVVGAQSWAVLHELVASKPPWGGNVMVRGFVRVTKRTMLGAASRGTESDGQAVWLQYLVINDRAVYGVTDFCSTAVSFRMPCISANKGRKYLSRFKPSVLFKFMALCTDHSNIC